MLFFKSIYNELKNYNNSEHRAREVVLGWYCWCPAPR